MGGRGTSGSTTSTAVGPIDVGHLMHVTGYDFANQDPTSAMAGYLDTNYPGWRTDPELWHLTYGPKLTDFLGMIGHELSKGHARGSGPFGLPIGGTAGLGADLAGALGRALKDWGKRDAAAYVIPPTAYGYPKGTRIGKGGFYVVPPGWASNGFGGWYRDPGHKVGPQPGPTGPILITPPHKKKP